MMEEQMFIDGGWHTPEELGQILKGEATIDHLYKLHKIIEELLNERYGVLVESIWNFPSRKLGSSEHPGEDWKNKRSNSLYAYYLEMRDRYSTKETPYPLPVFEAWIAYKNFQIIGQLPFLLEGEWEI